jgi:release factor glutamine methyltransferase
LSQTTVSAALESAKLQLTDNDSLTFSEPALEARLLFEHISGHGHTWQIVHADDYLTQAQYLAFDAVLKERLAGKPIAFITGKQAFWTLELAVSPCTLIPRQDTETLVEVCLSADMPAHAKVLDLGTGTGAIALSLAKERPQWQVVGVDAIDEAVELARNNATANGLKAHFLKSDWFNALAHQQFDMIVSNPPYVESNSRYLQQGDLRFEPHTALVSGEDGLEDIRFIIQHAPSYLHNDGWLLFEHGKDQADSIADLLKARGFVQIQHKKDYNDLTRVSFAKWQNT